MEVLVLVDFEGTMGDELTVRMGDVIKSVTKASDEGWLYGELRGKKGIFPASFVKEIPVYLRGDSQREPRSIRTTKKMKQTRRCEVLYAYKPTIQDELELVPGETLEIIREIEDGWWMGMKNGKVGAFPSNFVKEVFVSPKEVKHNESKVRPKLSNAVFSQEIVRKVSVRNKVKNTEYCQALFDYNAKAEDELEMKKGDVITITRKETDDEGWWEGELRGRCGFFPDNFVMVIPPVDTLNPETMSQLPARNVNHNNPVKPEAPAMERNGLAKTKNDKPESKDLRSNPPTKVKLPSLNKPNPPAVQIKPNKALPNRTSSDSAPPPSPKPNNHKSGDTFDGVDVQTEKLSHPTANRAKPPQRRPPSGPHTGPAPSALDQTETEPKKDQTDKLQKGPENPLSSTAKPEHPPKSSPPTRPTPPKITVEGEPVTNKDGLTVESLQAEIKELQMALELFQTRHERDMQEVKEELKEERNKRLALQDEVKNLKTKQ
ncbi:SH3 domain-containing protein 21 [Gouania willdenowi]|uniref:Osteoclast-stimulating factor 1 n=1 Tax=Gouania willdenowi TaxID=441366 RepID=A0A8C5G2Q4_GOUWI|nr:SH3 domain-containing protein 21 [Gouania willdenowi]